jgi:hypothetical protein
MPRRAGQGLGTLGGWNLNDCTVQRKAQGSSPDDKKECSTHVSRRTGRVMRRPRQEERWLTSFG